MKSNTDPQAYSSCIAWNDALAKELAHAEPYDLVVISHSASGTPYIGDEMQGFQDAWKAFGDAQLIIIRDTPRVPENTNECLENEPDDLLVCSATFSEAFPQPDVMVSAARSTSGAVVFDVTDLLCNHEYCPVTIGGVVVYRDSHHLTATFAKTLTPAIRELVLAAIAD